MLRDVIAGAGLSFYAEAAMILFLLTFFAVVLRVWARRPADDARMARLPLEDDEPSAVGSNGKPGTPEA
jgi:cbb3-type cytochrome oxidase subunit 3